MDKNSQVTWPTVTPQHSWDEYQVVIDPVRLIESNLHDLGITKYNIMPDGSVCVYENISVNGIQGVLPVKFSNVYGTVVMRNCSFTSLKNFPQWVAGTLQFNGCSLSSLDSDHIINAATISFNKVNGQISLKNIHKCFSTSSITFFGVNVRSPILGLCLIDNLAAITFSFNNLDFDKALRISKVISNKGRAGVLDAQAELIENDLEEFADV